MLNVILWLCYQAGGEVGGAECWGEQEGLVCPAHRAGDGHAHQPAQHRRSHLESENIEINLKLPLSSHNFNRL